MKPVTSVVAITVLGSAVLVSAAFGVRSCNDARARQRIADQAVAYEQGMADALRLATVAEPKQPCNGEGLVLVRRLGAGASRVKAALPCAAGDPQVSGLRDLPPRNQRRIASRRAWANAGVLASNPPPPFRDHAHGAP